MSDVLLRAALLARGYTDLDLQRMRGRGELTRVRRGAYSSALPSELTPEERHRLLVVATMPQLQAAGTLSHASAAVLHGLPVWPDQLDRVALTRPREGGGKSRRLLQIHSSPLGPEEVVRLDGLAVTSLARTVTDLGRTVALERAVAAGDAALRPGLDLVELEVALERCRGWRGRARAVATARMFDGHSESAGESVSRVRILQAGLPAPELQLEVVDDGGRLVGRADFAWPEPKVLGEFDGKIKYGRLLRPGDRVEDVVYREKVREDAMRDPRADLTGVRTLSSAWHLVQRVPEAAEGAAAGRWAGGS